MIIQVVKTARDYLFQRTLIQFYFKKLDYQTFYKELVAKGHTAVQGDLAECFLTKENIGAGWNRILGC